MVARLWYDSRCTVCGRGWNPSLIPCTAGCCTGKRSLRDLRVPVGAGFDLDGKDIGTAMQLARYIQEGGVSSQ